MFADCLRVVFNSNQAAAPGLPAAHLGYKVHVHMEKSKVCIRYSMQDCVGPLRVTAIWMSQYCLPSTPSIKLHDKQSSCCSRSVCGTTCFMRLADMVQNITQCSVIHHNPIKQSWCLVPHCCSDMHEAQRACLAARPCSACSAALPGLLTLLLWPACCRSPLLP